MACKPEWLVDNGDPKDPNEPQALQIGHVMHLEDTQRNREIIASELLDWYVRLLSYDMDAEVVPVAWGWYARPFGKYDVEGSPHSGPTLGLKAVVRW